MAKIEGLRIHVVSEGDEDSLLLPPYVARAKAGRIDEIPLKGFGRDSGRDDKSKARSAAASPGAEWWSRLKPAAICQLTASARRNCSARVPSGRDWSPA